MTGTTEDMKIRDESDLQELVRKKLSGFPSPYGWDDILEALYAKVEGTHGEVIDPDSALHPCIPYASKPLLST